MHPQPNHERLLRILFREFLLEPRLYEEAGLEDLPARLAALQGCGEGEALSKACADPLLSHLSLADLKSVLAVRDMSILSRTAAAVSSELRDPKVTYDQCVRTALIYGVVGRDREGHAFSALRAAAARNDRYARHHFLYGLFLGLQGNHDRACWELAMALHYEPYKEGQARIRKALEALEDPEEPNKK